MLDASLIIPTFNRREVLERTLERVAAIDFPRDQWQVIIVDDGSTDDTEAAVRRWMASSQLSAQFLQQANAGPAAARNLGAAHATGEFLLFIDNDIAVPRDFVRLHCEALRSHPESCIVGRVVNPDRLKDTAFGRYRWVMWERFHEAHAGDRHSQTSGVTGQNLAIAAEAFRRLGGFDEAFTLASSEDWELGDRARRAGLEVLYHPGIVVTHDDWAVSLEAFCERQRLYAISDVLLWQKYRERSPRLAVVLENGPADWKRDRSSLILKKGLKRLLATRPGRAALRVGCRFAERLLPEGPFTTRAFDTTVAVAIFRGVREGLVRYGVDDGSTKARPTISASAERPSLR